MHAPAVRLRRTPTKPRPAALPRDLRPKLRLLALIVVVAALLTGGWFALRDSTLVGVDRVEVTGASGPQRAAIRDALMAAGEDMTTLHVRPDVLRTAVAPYAVVKDVTAKADFPHGLTVHVVQHVAVASAVTSSGSVPLAADGTVLRGSVASGVPAIKLRLPPAGKRVTEPHVRETIALLAAAPTPLRRKIASAFRGPKGLTLRLQDGPTVNFGASDRIAAKWASLVAVLASPASRGATAIDVTVPEHPAAAGLEQRSIQEGQPSTTG